MEAHEVNGDQLELYRRGQFPSPSPPTCCPANQTLGNVDVQAPQPDGDHNPKPVKVTLRGACGAEAISRKPWTTVYSGAEYDAGTEDAAEASEPAAAAAARV